MQLRRGIRGADLAPEELLGLLARALRAGELPAGCEVLAVQLLVGPPSGRSSWFDHLGGLEPAALACALYAPAYAALAQAGHVAEELRAAARVVAQKIAAPSPRVDHQLDHARGRFGSGIHDARQGIGPELEGPARTLLHAVDLVQRDLSRGKLPNYRRRALRNFAGWADEADCTSGWRELVGWLLGLESELHDDEALRGVLRRAQGGDRVAWRTVEAWGRRVRGRGKGHRLLAGWLGAPRFWRAGMKGRPRELFEFASSLCPRQRGARWIAPAHFPSIARRASLEGALQQRVVNEVAARAALVVYRWLGEGEGPEAEAEVETERLAAWAARPLASRHLAPDPAVPSWAWGEERLLPLVERAVRRGAGEELREELEHELLAWALGLDEPCWCHASEKVLA
ncbi:MAG TPA: hypothetical protein DEA08_33650 [Planctomycetes bacterium]|nr:hypothetical protein [Planctomycetota bacterium]